MHSSPTTLNPPDADRHAEDIAPDAAALTAIVDVTEPTNHRGSQARRDPLVQRSYDAGQPVHIPVDQTVPRRPRWRIVRRAFALIRNHPGYANSPSQQALEGTRQRY